MAALWPRQCMATKGTPASATTVAMAGSARAPLTSFTRAAPAERAAEATCARMVSMLTTAPAEVSSRTTGSTRRSSSSTDGRLAPGRVDSPPTSRMSAPCPSSSRPCATAADGSNHSPPSLNESGVTLTTPITTGSPSARASGQEVIEVIGHHRADRAWAR